MKIDYRPEIDGLRAIAVLAVVLYHADIEINGKALMPGGYLGVDIFLVISGYLITSLILKELELTNTFSLKNFYDRRARRILPALLSVILLCFIPAWMTRLLL
jgi:peptidoglycan/LPS O-acetylase OafA/YrhL